VNSFLKELRCAARTLLKTPGVTLVAVAVIALGIPARRAIQIDPLTALRHE
jgi:ABC-type antimicrobial peptide transport system permease subunit